MAANRMPHPDPTPPRSCCTRRPAKDLSPARRPVALRPAVLVPLDDASARLAVQALHDLLTGLRPRSEGHLTRAGRAGLLDREPEREGQP